MIVFVADREDNKMNNHKPKDRQVLLPKSSDIDRIGHDIGGGRFHGVARGKKNPLYQALSHRISALRARAGLAQHELADLANISRQAVSLIESGQRTSKISTIEGLATALGISPAYLGFGEDGHLRWRERHPRFGLDPDPPPAPDPAPRACPESYRAMGARLRLAREAKGLSMRALGRAAGCTVASISLVEAGTSVVLLSTCEDLAKALYVAPGWLAYEIGQGPGT